MPIASPSRSSRRHRAIIILLGSMTLAGCASRRAGDRFADLERRILHELAQDNVAAPSSGAIDDPPQPRAALPQHGPITLDDLFAAAEAGNPALAAARSEIGIAAGRMLQASLHPNPRVEIASEEVPFRSGLDEGVTTASFTQPIVLGERRRAGLDAGAAERDASRARAEMRLRDIFGEIALLHAQLLANRQAETLYRELADLSDQTLNMARTRFEARAAPETEVIRPQIERHHIELALARLASERQAAREALRMLIGGAPVDVDRLAGEVTDQPPPMDLEALALTMRHSHPALALADREIDAAAARLRRIDAERTPDLDLRFGAGYDGERDEGIFEVGAGVTLPLWDRRQGDTLSARFDVMRARQQRLAIENDLQRQLAEAHGAYEAARAQIDIVRDQIVPAAMRSLAQTQEAYRAGRGGFLELLDAQRTLIEARAALIELSGAAAKARARITTLTGPGASGPLPSHPTQSQTEGDPT